MHSPARMARWPIVAGIVLVAGWIAATAGLHASAPSPRPASGYLLTASDAHFTAAFPRKPPRIEKTAGTTTVIVYLLYPAANPVAPHGGARIDAAPIRRTARPHTNDDAELTIAATVNDIQSVV